MKLRTFFMIVSIVGLIFSLGLLLAPQFMNTTYSGATSASEELTNRLLGAALLGLSVIVWMSKDLTGASVRPIITGSLIAEVVGLVVALIGTLGGVMGSAGWSLVVIYLLFGLGFAYFQFMAPPK